MILPCDCSHPGQDKLYGKGLRVHNSKTKTLEKGRFRCTVCGVEKH